jgi:hypothetical protein
MEMEKMRKFKRELGSYSLQRTVYSVHQYMSY